MPLPLQVDLWPFDIKVVSESRVRLATSVPILVFLGHSVLNLGQMYATDRHQTDRQTSDMHHRLMPPPYGAGHNNQIAIAPTLKTHTYPMTLLPNSVALDQLPADSILSFCCCQYGACWGTRAVLGFLHLGLPGVPPTPIACWVC